MQFEIDNIYHIYNQGNNRDLVFYSRENYLYFLQLYRKFVWQHADLLAYCLMPNHFHLLINTNSNSVKTKRVGSLHLSELSNGIRMLLSSYASAINNQRKRSGSLFRQKTKAKLLNTNNVNYPFICFQYIHQNPVNAGLVNKMEDWEFSSFRDYINVRNGTLCNKLFANQLIGFDENDIKLHSKIDLITDDIKNIF